MKVKYYLSGSFVVLSAETVALQKGTHRSLGSGFAGTMSIEMEDEVNVNRQLSVFKHIKKKAANDAQLLMYVSLNLL